MAELTSVEVVMRINGYCTGIPVFCSKPFILERVQRICRGLFPLCTHIVHLYIALMMSTLNHKCKHCCITCCIVSHV
jgi:hypothetical protein